MSFPCWVAKRPKEEQKNRDTKKNNQCVDQIQTSTEKVDRINFT